ncbi:MAG: Ig-like domain-containing protein, partial [Pseudomonadota bacterium]
TNLGATTSQSPIEVEIAFEEDVDGLAILDFVLVNATVSNLRNTVANRTWLVDVTPDAQGDLSILLPVGTAEDDVQNLSDVSNTLEIEYDSLAPADFTVSFDQDPIDQSKVGAVSFTFAGAEVDSEFSFTIKSDAGGDVISQGGLVTAADQQIDLGDIAYMSDGTLTLSVTLQDAALNVSNTAEDTVQLDTVGPIPTLSFESLTPGSTTNAELVGVELSFDAPIDGSFDSTVFTVQNATIENFSYVAGNNAGTFDLKPISDAAVTVQLEAGKLTGQDGNGNSASEVLTFTSNRTAPVLTEVTAPPSLTNNPNVSYVFETTKPGTITYGGACTSSTAAAVQGNNTVSFETLADETYNDCTITVTDAFGNASNTLDIPTFEVDTMPPGDFTVELLQDPINLANQDSVSFTISGGEDGARYDYEIFGPSPSGADDGDGFISANLQTIQIGDVSSVSDGTVTLTVTLKDAAGNITSAVTDTATKDTGIAKPTLAFTATGPTNSTALEVTVDFGEPVTFFSAPLDATAFTITNATVQNSAVTDDGDGIYRLVLVPSTADTVTIAVPASAVSDLAGNPNPLSDTASIVFDNVAPELALVTPVPTPTMDTTPSFTFSSDEDGTITYGADFCQGDLTDAVDGNNTVTLAELPEGIYDDCQISVTDAAGNRSQKFELNLFEIITSAPTVTLGSTAPNPTNVSPITVDVTFSRSVSTLSVSDFNITNESAVSLSGSGASYTLQIQPASDGTVTVDLPANVVTDAANNPNAAAEQPFEIEFDGTAPVLSVTTPVPDLSNNPTPQVSFNSDQDGKITYVGACTSLTVDAVNGVNTVTFDTLVDGTYSDCQLTVTDPAGNVSETLDIPEFEIDTRVPSVTLSTAITSPTNVSPVTINVDFTVDVENLLATDFVLTNASLSSTDPLTGSGQAYVLTIVPGVTGDVRVSLPAAAASTPAGTDSLASNELVFEYDITAPMLTEVTPVQALGMNPTPSYTFNTDEPGTISYGGACSSATTIAVLDDNTVTFEALRDDTYSDCTIIVTDDLGNVSTPLSVSEFTIDTAQAEVTLTSAITSPTNISPIEIEVRFTKPIDAVTADDFTLVNATAAPISGGGTDYLLMITPIDDGPVEVSLAEGAVTDAAGNGTLASNIITIEYDGSAPELTIVSAIPTLVATATPSFTVNTTEDGDLTFAGTCQSQLTTVALGDNMVTLDSLADATYSDCSITVTDDVGNTSIALIFDPFTVDTSAPTLAEVTPITGRLSVSGKTESPTPSYTFTTTQAGTISYGGSCSSPITSATIGENTVEFTALAEGTYDDCMLMVTDAAGNDSNKLTVSQFEIDLTAPILSEVEAIVTPSQLTQPAYTFNSTQAGTITFGGVCTSTTDKAIVGDTRVHFDALPDGTYADCTIQVADQVGNLSEPLTVNTFTIDTEVPTVLSLSAPAALLDGALPVTVVFSEPVTGFDAASDLELTNAIADPPSEVSPFDGTTYEVLVSPDLQFEGQVDILVASGAAEDGSGNPSEASSILTLDVDTVAPTVQVSADITTLGLQDTAIVTFALSEATSDFTRADILVTGGTLIEFSGSGMAYSAIFTPTIGAVSNQGIGTDSVIEGAFFDGFGNANLASNELELDYGSALVDRTSRIVNNFMVRRADQITSNDPDLSRRLDRLSGGSEQAGSFSGQGDFSRNNQFNFATSLSQVAAWQNRDQRAQAAFDAGELGVFGAKPMARTHGSMAADVWMSGTYARIENETATSTLGLFHVGVDYLVTEDLVLGVMGQVDFTEEADETSNFSASGLGWMIGPYFVTELQDALVWDGRVAWGKSDNDLRPFDTYKDEFETDRWLVSSKVTGGMTFADFDLRPQLGLIYFEERQNVFTDSNGLVVPEHEVSLGRLTFSPNFSRSFTTPTEDTLTTNWTVTGIWDFDTADLINIDSGLIATRNTDLRARTEFGLALRMQNGIAFGADGFYDGIGVEDYQAYGGTISLSIPLQ